MRSSITAIIQNAFFRNIFLIGLSMLLINATTYDTSTPENYAKELIKILQKADIKEFKKFYPNCEDFKTTFSEAIKDSTRKANVLSEENIKTKCEEELDRNYKRYKEVIDYGKQQGIIWKKIKYKRVEYEIKKGDYDIPSIYKTQVYFTYNDQEYYVEIKGLGKLKNGWNGGKIYGPRQMK